MEETKIIRLKKLLEWKWGQKIILEPSKGLKWAIFTSNAFLAENVSKGPPFVFFSKIRENPNFVKMTRYWCAYVSV